jgi:hypothetical protein
MLVGMLNERDDGTSIPPPLLPIVIPRAGVHEYDVVPEYFKVPPLRVKAPVLSIADGAAPKWESAVKSTTPPAIVKYGWLPVPLFVNVFVLRKFSVPGPVFVRPPVPVHTCVVLWVRLALEAISIGAPGTV